MCRSYGTFLIREKGFVRYFLVTGLKSVVNMYRSYGTFLTLKKGFVRYYLITGLKSVVSMCRSYGTYFRGISIFCSSLDHRIKIRC